MEITGIRLPRIFRRAATTAVAAALVAGAAAPALAAPGAGPDRPELQQAIQEIVDSGLAGVQLRVRDERGEWVGSTGVRELGQTAAPPTDGHFRIGSNTKTFVATLVLQLVAAGDVGLDNPAADYLPDLGVDRRITVRHLLQQTSGLFDYTGDTYPNGQYVPGIPWQGKAWVDKRFHTYQPKELARLGLSEKLKFDPGTNWAYSNTNYVLAALLVENVTRRPYGEELRQRILEPLGMSGTEVPGVSPELREPHAHGYYGYRDDKDADKWKVVDVTRQNPSWIHAAGEMTSTTADLQTFFAALHSGKLLPPALLAEMRTPFPDNVLGYGLGLMAQKTGPNCGGTVYTHNGGVKGYGVLMYSSADGRTTMIASLTSSGADIDEPAAFGKAQQRLVDAVFCRG